MNTTSSIGTTPTTNPSPPASRRQRAGLAGRPHGPEDHLLDPLVANKLPGGRRLDAWHSLLQAHATLMRQLAMDLERETGLALADFDVLAHPSVAGASCG